ncbi:MAG: heme-binding protein [Propionibacteriales bacterium]|nr:heme-binding protein [Propionibacteriales bacterium]
MWGTLVNRDGFVCAVAFSGPDRDNQWPGSRIISAQKAHTANAFSQPPDGIGGRPDGLFQGLSLSTANLFSAVQPGGSLYGLQHSNPVDPAAAYSGDPTLAGLENDPIVGQKVGGVNVFGGGLALYTQDALIGALGVSGDTSCTDHVIAWKIRDAFELDNIPSGVLPNVAGGDNIIHDRAGGESASGFGHPTCTPPATAEAAALPLTHPLG